LHKKGAVFYQNLVEQNCEFWRGHFRWNQDPSNASCCRFARTIPATVWCCDTA
jgi:hypothetical protein